MGTSAKDADQFSGEHIQAFREKMRKADVPAEVIDLFCSYFTQLVSSHRTGLIPEDDIEAVEGEDITSHQDLHADDIRVGQSLMGQSVLIKLNGGLGTSMGMPFAKSLVKVTPDKTFLDVIIQQAGLCEGRGVPLTLVLMNSFNTQKDTRDFLEQSGCAQEDNIFLFEQHLYPKILKESMMPAECPEAPEQAWNPPGHGDLFAALHTSGMLERLLEQGRRYAFISNADNLGAVLDPGMLGYFVRKGAPFLMEVAWRGPADKKGGHLAKKNHGQLILREVAQCPENDLPHFQDIGTHSYFNTNNIWIDLQRLQERIQQEGLPRLPLIVNPKTLDPRNPDSPEVYQLETALGAAIAVFENSGAIRVPRDRFLPVKKTDDLLAVRSDCYVFGPDFQLKPNPERELEPISVDLDEQWYKLVDAFEARFPEGPPSLVACRSLRIKGDVRFGAGVICRGDVVLENRSEAQVRIPDHQELRGHQVYK